MGQQPRLKFNRLLVNLSFFSLLFFSAPLGQPICYRGSPPSFVGRREQFRSCIQEEVEQNEVTFDVWHTHVEVNFCNSDANFDLQFMLLRQNQDNKYFSKPHFSLYKLKFTRAFITWTWWKPTKLHERKREIFCVTRVITAISFSLQIATTGRKFGWVR